MPISEKGARLDKFLSKQSGSKVVLVIPNNANVRVVSMPAVNNNARMVSANIIEYDNTAKQVLKVQVAAGIQEVESPTD